MDISQALIYGLIHNKVMLPPRLAGLADKNLQSRERLGHAVTVTQEIYTSVIVHLLVMVRRKKTST